MAPAVVDHAVLVTLDTGDSHRDRDSRFTAGDRIDTEQRGLGSGIGDLVDEQVVVREDSESTVVLVGCEEEEAVLGGSGIDADDRARALHECVAVGREGDVPDRAQ